MTMKKYTQNDMKRAFGCGRNFQLTGENNFKELIDELDKEEPRFILDIRCGCAAVRDTKHPKYDKDYPGLHHDTCDVVEYKHGFQNTEKECWEMKDEDIKYLTDYCASLNGE